MSAENRPSHIKQAIVHASRIGLGAVMFAASWNLASTANSRIDRDIQSYTQRCYDTYKDQLPLGSKENPEIPPELAGAQLNECIKEGERRAIENHAFGVTLPSLAVIVSGGLTVAESISLSRVIRRIQRESK